LPEEFRKQIFFLNANDLYFKPRLNPVGQFINTRLESKEGYGTFTDVALGEN